MRRPVNAPINITTEFGVRTSTSKFGYHVGVDYSKATGASVYAPKSGTVTLATGDTAYNGRVVQIYDGQFYHRMMHNSSILVKVGQKVSEGQLVAKSGNSDGGTNNNTGPHVHWDICTVKYPTSFAQFKDPAKWLAGAYKPTVTYPRTVTVVVDKVYVRNQPTTNSSLAGSRYLTKGQTFKAVAKVVGQEVNGNKYWYKSSLGNYVWSGGCK